MTAPTTTAAAGENILGRPARPGGAAYWARVRRIVDQAPPLTDEQRVAIRIAIHGCTGTGRAAA